MEHLRQSGAVAVATRPSAMTAAMASSKGYRLCEHDRLSWMRGGPAQLVNACRHARTDKFTTHHYEHLYHAVLAPIALSACSAVGSSGASDAVAPWVAPGAAGSRLSDLTIRLLEIGLGCGMPLGPGGGVSVFRRLLGVFRLELHVLEYAGECARQWAAENGACVASMGACVDPRDNSSLRGVTVHVGDQNSTRDLDAMFAAAGALPFDVIVDDGSHHHEHQLTSVAHALTSGMLASGGTYVIEDLSSSCYNYVSMEPGSTVNANGRAVGRSTGGTSDCLLSVSGRPTTYARLVEWQKRLLHRNKRPFGVVERISIFEEAAALHLKL